jgi:hypothetical protein
MSGEREESRMTMEPPEQVRQWIHELLGVRLEEDWTERSLGVWAVLGPALAAVHEATFPVETEPATLLVVPSADEPQSEGGGGDAA